MLMTVVALQASAQGITESAGLTISKMHKQQGQTSASWTQCCRNNGIMLPTHILEMYSSNLTTIERFGSSVTNVQMAICTAGLLLYTTEVEAGAAPSAQGGNCVSTIVWPLSAL